MKTKRVFAVMTVLLMLVGLTAVAGAARPAQSDVYWFWGDPAGSATIVRSGNGISGQISTSLSNETGSYGGFAVTVWLVVFNEPSHCAEHPDPCIEDDLFNADVKPDVLWGGGHIIGANEGANFGVHLKAGDNATSIADIFGMPVDENGEPFGLIDAETAEVHYVLRSHGPKEQASVDDMLFSYGGGCVTDYLAPGDEGDLHFAAGDCQDIQFAIHQAP